MQSNEAKISIVTIAYNAVMEIKDTIDSVLSQSYYNIEYIIIDGGSTDGTVEIIKHYKHKITSWISEKDHGIYDAMNKGNQKASGDYIIFLNAGDTFTNTSVIENMIKNTNGKIYSLITGRTRNFYQGDDLGVISPPKNATINEKSITYSHQGTLIHKTIYKNYLYETLYSICSDREYWYRAKSSANFSVLFCNIEVSRFNLGGISNNHKNVLGRRLEDLFIEYKYNGINLAKLTKMYIVTILTYLVTLNEDWYYRKVYVIINKFKNRKTK